MGSLPIYLPSIHGWLSSHGRSNSGALVLGQPSRSGGLGWVEQWGGLVGW